MKRQVRYMLLGAVLLCVVEQGIKLIVNRNLNASFPILPPLLYFQPMFNRDYSWINSMFQLGVGRGIHIALVLAMLVLIFLAYRYCAQRSDGSRYVNAMFSILIAGALCSLIDKLFWGGSLDYILLKGFFTFDLKDVYINAFIAMFILGLVFKNKALWRILDLNKGKTEDRGK